MKTDQFWSRIIYIVSVIISLAVAFLILGPRPEGTEGSLDVSMLPLFNASLNGIVTVLLIFGFILIFLLRSSSLNNGTGLPVPAFIGELCDAVAAISM